MEFNEKGISNNFLVFGFYKNIVMGSFLEAKKKFWKKTVIEMECHSLVSNILSFYSSYFIQVEKEESNLIYGFGSKKKKKKCGLKRYVLKTLSLVSSLFILLKIKNRLCDNRKLNK